jgi:hypothetical protein
VALILLGFFLVLILRNFLVLTLLPPLISWFITRKTRIPDLYIFTGVSLLFVVFFFCGPYLSDKLDFPAATVIKQQEFQHLGGGSAVAVNRLEPNLKSFIVNAPQALSLSLLRPYPSDVRHLLSLAASLEINILLLFFLLFLFFRRKDVKMEPFIWFSLFFSFGVLMMAGYTVNILGAIVRYRSIVLPLLVAPMLASTDWGRLLKKAGINLK